MLTTLLTPIGLSRKGLLWRDLTKMPHLLIAGESGGGKSNFIHQAIVTLAKYDCRIFIIDLKRVDFSAYEKVAWYTWDLPEALQILRCLEREMLIRQELFHKAGVVKIQDYPHYLPYCVLIIDELSQLTPKLAKDKTEKTMCEEAYAHLTDILSLARALGIHVILGTQGAYAEVIPGLMKVNIPARLAFRCATPEGSEIILGRGNYEAFYLPKIPGRAIWQFGTEQHTVQVMHLPVDKAKILLPNEKEVLRPRQEVITGEV